MQRSHKTEAMMLGSSSVLARLIAHASNLPRLLNWIWISMISMSLLALLPLPFQSLLRACYMRGKLLHTPSPSIFTVPQRFFLHFYIVGVAVNTFMLLTAISHAYFYSFSTTSSSLQFSTLAGQLFGTSTITTALSGKSVPAFAKHLQQAWRTVFILALMEMQVVRRLYESLYVSKFSSQARMHIVAYVTGIIYYTMVPLSLCASTAGEMIKATIQSFVRDRYGQNIEDSIFEMRWWQWGKFFLKIGWLPWIGAAVFLWGWIHQYRCHMILASLRSGKDRHHKQKKEYKIPYGDWFEHVSSAHYLAEIVMYFGFVIATGGQDLTVWLLFIWVVVNLSVAADDTHKWYLSNFREYPQSRWAICPFIY